MSIGSVTLIAAVVMVAAALVTPSVVLGEVELSEESPERRFYAVVYARGSGFVEKAIAREQPGIEEHIEFIMGLYANGVVPLGGALFDDDEREQVSGILYLVKAGSVQEARDIALMEPMVRTKVVELVSVREFLVGVGAGRLD